MAAYQTGETIRLKAAITDVNDVVVNPATVTISINKPAKVVDVVAAVMESSEVGLYYYDYLIPSAITGTYNWKVVATGAGDRITIVKSSFEVGLSI